MHSRKSKSLSLSLAVAMLGPSLLAGCAHGRIAEIEPSRVAHKLGFADCTVTESMRRYQTLDYADRLGDSNLEHSPEWHKAMAIMQPGDELRYVYCKSGDNFFGLFRGTSLLLKFGGFLFD